MTTIRARLHQSSQTRGFTLIETAIVVVIIAIIAGLVLVGLRGAILGGRLAGEQQLVRSLGVGVENFKQQFGFVPPLVHDDYRTAGPLTDPDNNTLDLVVRDAEFLRADAANVAGNRYSEYAIAYYIIGAGGKAVDGVEGPGMTEPSRVIERNGLSISQFTQRGRKVEPFFDISGGNLKRLDRIDPAANPSQKIVIRDRWQTPIRYYRWAPEFFVDGQRKGEVERDNIPAEVGNPEVDPALRAAEWAVVSAGPNRVFGDEPIAELRAQLNIGSGDDSDVIDKAIADNLTEVGK